MKYLIEIDENNKLTVKKSIKKVDPLTQNNKLMWKEVSYILTASEKDLVDYIVEEYTGSAYRLHIMLERMRSQAVTVSDIHDYLDTIEEEKA